MSAKKLIVHSPGKTGDQTLLPARDLRAGAHRVHSDFDLRSVSHDAPNHRGKIYSLPQHEQQAPIDLRKGAQLGAKAAVTSRYGC